MTPRIIDIKIDKAQDGKEIRQILRDFGVSAALLTKLRLDDDGVKLNGVHAKAIEKVNTNDILTICIKKSGTPPTPNDIKLNIIYEDEDTIAIDKPSLMPVHESRNHRGDALSNALSNYLDDMGAFRAVFRLDRDTSGLVLVAKNEFSAAKLAGKIKKDYYAICDGVINHSGTIDAPIARLENTIIKRTVSDNGDNAVTHYEPVLVKDNHTLLKLHLETGRTHQIRVHMAHIGHPLLGDTLYGGSTKLIARQALHCKTIYFTHPITGKEVTVACPFPADFKGVI